MSREIATEPAELIEAFERSHFGFPLEPDERTKLAALARFLDCDADELLYCEGDITPYFGVVDTGRVDLRTHVAGRGNVGFMTVEPGDMLGWSALIPPYRSRADVVAVTDVRLLIIPATELRALLAEDQSLAASVYLQTVASLGRRLGATRMLQMDLFGAPTMAEHRRPRGPTGKRFADVGGAESAYEDQDTHVGET